MKTTKPTILIIDDEKNTRDGLKLAFEDKYTILLAENAIKGLVLLKENPVQIVLTDYKMPGIDGLDFIRQVNACEKKPLVIMLTAYGSVQTGLTAMDLGAYDYVTKPVDLENLEMIIDRGLATLVQENQEANEENSSKELSNIIANSKLMQKVMMEVRQVADSTATVLLTGESGTGKEVLANALHALSSRAAKPFIPVHCAALNENLLESELFGHEKGAFTGASERRIGRFEMANTGTLFLDEIGEITLPTQVKLLRVLETKSFERVGGKESITCDVRLIAATNRNLPQMVKEGTFREDLFYRLNVVSIQIPPLRERKEDIPALLTFFLKRNSDAQKKNISGFGKDAIEMLTAYNWPGNVRELRNCVENMTVFARGALLTMSDIPQEIRQRILQQFSEVQEAEKPMATAENEILDIKMNEKELIKKALIECDNNRSRAAEKLNISRRTLQRKLKDYGIN